MMKLKIIAIVVLVLIALCGCESTPPTEAEETTSETSSVITSLSESKVTTDFETTEKQQSEMSDIMAITESVNRKLVSGYIREITPNKYVEGLCYEFTREELDFFDAQLRNGYEVGEEDEIANKYIIRIFDEKEALAFELVADENGNVYTPEHKKLVCKQIDAFIKKLIENK